MPEGDTGTTVPLEGEFAFESEQFRTVGYERTILVVSRSLITTLWHMEFLDEVLADPRIQVVFTVEDEQPGAFSRGALDTSDAIDALHIPWSEAVSRRFDLAMSASFRGSLHRLDAPLLLGLHGGGLGKQAALPRGRVFPVSRSSSASTKAQSTTVALAHLRQAAAVASEQPEVEMAIVGDPCLDRLHASQPQRELYRRALGLLDTQRLIVVSSTWGPDSVLGVAPDVGQRLAAELPADLYRVALIVHPHVWTTHGAWQVTAWMKRAREAGVLAMAPWQNAWRSALVASDAVIHDHGSVALYAAALGKPLLALPLRSASIRPDSAIDRLGLLVPKLDLTSPLRPQVDEVIDAGPSPSYADIGEQVSSAHGEALKLHRDLIYRLISLEPPPHQPRTLAMSVPREPLPPIRSHRVHTSIDANHNVSVDRFPLLPPPPPHQHLVSDIQEPDTRIVASAAIVTDATGAHQADELFRRYAGCRYVVLEANDKGLILMHRHRGSYRLHMETATAVNPHVAASACFALESAGRDLDDLADCTVIAAGSEARFSVNARTA